MRQGRRGKLQILVDVAPWEANPFSFLFFFFISFRLSFVRFVFLCLLLLFVYQITISDVFLERHVVAISQMRLIKRVREALLTLQASLPPSLPPSLLERAFKGMGVHTPDAVALVINSPGGSPVQSNLIGQKILALQEKHKVPVWSFAEVRREGGREGGRGRGREGTREVGGEGKGENGCC